MDDDEWEHWLAMIRILLDMIKQAPGYDPITYNELENDVQNIIDKHREIVNKKI
jgi:hypothetical protein